MVVTSFSHIFLISFFSVEVFNLSNFKPQNVYLNTLNDANIQRNSNSKIQRKKKLLFHVATT